jgi:hypothetical protein
MTAIFLDPGLWPRLHPLLIAHDVGGSRDRSTAVVGGYSGYAPGILASRNSTSCRKASMAATAPVHWRRLMPATTAMR